MRFFSFLAIASLSLSLITACKNEPKGVETEHGYRVVNHTNKEGAKPKTGDLIKVHVSLTVGDTMLQDTRKISPEPREVAIPDFSQIPAGRKVPAIFDGALMAAKGDSITIYQPMDSAFALQLPKRLQNEKYMRFDLVLYDITTAEDMKKVQEESTARFAEIQTKVTETVAAYKAGKLSDKITTMPSGLKIMIEDKGKGEALKAGTQVKTHYYGALIDGKMFDNSFQRGEPLPFMLGAGQMIKGFDEGAQQLNHGGRAFFFIPPALGYGDKAEKGSPIPANSELIFYVEAL
jgi:FKBP-type peptidyl-prolyl cis-trans isomerase FkpA